MRLYDFYGSPDGSISIADAGSRSYIKFKYMAADICRTYSINPSTRSLDAKKERWNVTITGEDVLPLANVIMPKSTIFITQQEDGAEPEHLLIKVRNGTLTSTMTIERKQLKITKTEN